MGRMLKSNEKVEECKKQLEEALRIVEDKNKAKKAWDVKLIMTREESTRRGLSLKKFMWKAICGVHY